MGAKLATAEAASDPGALLAVLRGALPVALPTAVPARSLVLPGEYCGWLLYMIYSKCILKEGGNSNIYSKNGVLPTGGYNFNMLLILKVSIQMLLGQEGVDTTLTLEVSGKRQGIEKTRRLCFLVFSWSYWCLEEVTKISQ